MVGVAGGGGVRIGPEADSTPSPPPPPLSYEKWGGGGGGGGGCLLLARSGHSETSCRRCVLFAILTLYDRVSGDPGYSTVVEFMRNGYQ